MYDLYIGNKNYSSWSLRPWVLLKTLGIPFAEHLVPFHDRDAWADYRKIAPSGLVPMLWDNETRVWETLAIAEYLAERHDGVWPKDATARAFARCAAAEMHAGFSTLRNVCGMNIGVRVRLHERPAALDAELARLQALWNDGLDSFGGPFLAGAHFTAADAFYCPVAFRVQTYDLRLDPLCMQYVKTLLDLPAMREWHAAGVAEAFRDWKHEDETLSYGDIVDDGRPAAINARGQA